MQRLTLHPQTIQALTAGAGSLTIDLGSNGHAHWFIGVQFYQDAAGDDLATPTAGLIDVDVKTEVLPDVWQRLPDSISVPAGNSQLDWESPTRQVKVTLSGISGDSAAYYKVFVASVES